MSRFGKCQNLSGCLLAYRGEETEVEKDQPFICAECGKPLVEVKSPAAFWMRYVYGLLGILVLAGVAFAVFPPLRGMISKGKGHKEEGDPRRAPIEQPSTDNPPTTTGDTGTPAPGDTAPTGPVAEPPKFVTSPQRIEMDITKQENKSVKAEVLTRVDLMPNV